MIIGGNPSTTCDDVRTNMADATSSFEQSVLVAALPVALSVYQTMKW